MHTEPTGLPLTASIHVLHYSPMIVIIIIIASVCTDNTNPRTSQYATRCRKNMRRSPSQRGNHKYQTLPPVLPPGQSFS